MRAWPGQKFLIELTGWDQFFQSTMANARLLFITNIQVYMLITLTRLYPIVLMATCSHTYMLRIVTIKEVKVNLNPEVIVITAAGENSTLIKDFTLTYSISSGDALTANSLLGTITIHETFNKATVIRG